MTTAQNLEELCPFDGRTIGDHTMREWAEHLDREHTDVPYAPVEGQPITTTLDGEPLPIADTIIARSTLLETQSGRAVYRVPCLIIDYQVGQPGSVPRDLARIGLVAPPDTMRKMGKLLRDAAYGAANAGEKRR